MTLALLHVYWRLVGPTGKTITCGLYRTPAGFLEVRAGYHVDDVLRSQLVKSRELADAAAATWKIAASEKGFTDLDAPPN